MGADAEQEAITEDLVILQRGSLPSHTKKASSKITLSRSGNSYISPVPLKFSGPNVC